MPSFYTLSEDSLLEQYFGTIPHKKLAAMLPGRGVDSIRHRARKLGLKTPGRSYMVSIAKRRYTHDESFFDVPCPLVSYWAGYVAADGCLPYNTRHFSICASIRDKEHLEDFKEALKFTGPITEYPLLANGMCRLRIWVAPGLRCALNLNYKITPRKSLTLEPPSLNPANAAAFAIGYIDGDGSIQITKQGYLRLYVIGTLQFLNWLTGIFRVFTKDLDATTRYAQATIRGSKHMRNYTFAATGRRAKLILQSLLGIANREKLPILERKWRIVKESM